MKQWLKPFLFPPPPPCSRALLLLLLLHALSSFSIVDYIVVVCFSDIHMYIVLMS
jgi:hypothetical protein